MAPGPQHHHGRRPARSSHAHLAPRPASRRTLSLRNHQPLCDLDLHLLRRIILDLLRECWPGGSFDLAIHLLAAPEMTRLNQTFLHHQGSTDVITFDYSEKARRASPPSPALLHGEIFVCLNEALSQARRFRATWQSELVRYLVHGLLHLLGYDDLRPPDRRELKKAEDALVRRLARQFDFRALGKRRPSNRS